MPEAVGWPRRIAAGLLAIGAAYGYWIRPTAVYGWSAESLPRFAMSIGVAAFGFAVAGAVIVLLDRRRDEATLYATVIALGLTLPVLWNPEITPALMWSLRRYQSFLPLVFLFAAAPLWQGELMTLKRRDARMMRLMGTLVAVFLVVPLALQGWTYRGFKEPGETIALVNQIAAGVEDNAVLVFEARSGWGALDYAPALAYWKGFDVFWLRDKQTDAVALRDLVRRQNQAGRPVYFFTQGFNYHFDEPRMVPHQRWWIERRQLEETLGVMPEQLLTSTLPLSSYRLEASGRNEPLAGGIDIGEWDDNYVGEALPWEQSDELTARWTKGSGFFWLPGLDEQASQITVHAGTIAGSGAYNRTLRATLDGIDLGEIPIEQDWTDYVFDVPSDWRPADDAAPMLVLITEPLQPDEVVGNGDTRYLGVLVNAILWR